MVTKESVEMVLSLAREGLSNPRDRRAHGCFKADRGENQKRPAGPEQPGLQPRGWVRAGTTLRNLRRAGYHALFSMLPRVRQGVPADNGGLPTGRRWEPRGLHPPVIVAREPATGGFPLGLRPSLQPRRLRVNFQTFDGCCYYR